MSPNPGAIGQGTICNSGDNVTNLCFTTQPAGNLNVCAGAPFTLTGTYSSYGPSNTPINWSGLIGCNAAQSDWRVQIYDCIGGDAGTFTNATIAFSNLQSIGGSPTSINYNSGTINSAINDGSCSTGTASVFQVSGNATPITVSATSMYTWTSSAGGYIINNPSSTLNQSFTNIPSGTTTFYLTSQVTFNGQTCSDVASVPFLNTCCPAIANAGNDTTICTGSAIQIGSSLSFGDTYTWASSSNISDTAISQPNFMFTNPGTVAVSNYYYLSVYDGTYDCTSNDSILITIPASPVIKGDTLICNLNYQISNTQSYFGGSWSSSASGVLFSDDQIANPLVTFPNDGIFQLTYTENACNTSLSANVTIPFIPVVFADTTVCSTQLNIPLSQVNTFGAATWISNPSGAFSPSNSQTATSYNVNTIGSYQLILTDNACPGKSDTVVVTFKTAPTVSIPSLACDLTTLDISSTVPAGETVSWSAIDNPTTPFLEDTSINFINGTTSSSQNPDITVDLPGTYTIGYNITGDCPLVGTKNIYFPPYLFTEINDTSLCLGIDYTLNAYQSPYNVSYSWNTGATGTSILITEPGVYSVSISNECPTHTVTDYATINYYICDIEVPNIISLSSTAGNNLWKVKAQGVAEFECVIVNRWGNVIYQFNDINSGWNGQTKNGNLVDEGVYFYHIKAKILGGDDLEKQGSITVVH